MYKVLLVEDESAIRRRIRNWSLWTEGEFELMGDAGDGEVALELIRENRPDIIITDIRMPFMDGLEFSEKAKLIYPDVHIIILSGYDDFQYAKKAIRIGVDEYILKPVTPDALKSSLDEAARRIGNLSRKSYREYLRVREPEKEEGQLEDIKAVDRDRIHDVLMTGDAREAELFITDFVAENRAKFRSTLFRHYLIASLYSEISSMLNTLSLDSSQSIETVFSSDQALDRIENEDLLREELKAVMERAIRLRDEEMKSHNAIRRACHYISRNYADSLMTMTDVADFVGLTPAYFSTKFKKETGKTFVRYTNELRIERAKALLKGTDSTIAEVAAAVGFDDPAYFDVIFKRETGMTPKQYKGK